MYFINIGKLNNYIKIYFKKCLIVAHVKKIFDSKVYFTIIDYVNGDFGIKIYMFMCPVIQTIYF
jgi:hypothetical protein